MNWKAISTVYFKELRDTVRDKRTLISTLVVPTVVIPLLFFGAGFVMQKVIKKAQQEQSSIMIVGGEDSPELVAALKAHEEFRVVTTTEDFKAAVTEKRIRAAVDIPAGFDAALLAGDEVPTVKIYHYQGELKSKMGRDELRSFLTDYREARVQAALEARNLPASVVEPFKVETENVAPPEKVGGNAIGGFVPYMIVILCFTGAMYPAMDLTAGEKERGTMETLLCSPLGRINIVMGKFFMVLTASATTVALTVIMMGVSAFVAPMVFAAGAGGGAGAAAGGGGMPMLIDPVGLLGVFAMVVPVAVLFAAAELAISLFAKSFKEAQSLVSPLMIVIIIPTAMGMLPGIELSAKTALIPIMNLSLVCKEMLSGTWNWDYIALIFGSSAVYAGIALWLCVKMFNREDVIFRS
ncbi:ABC transporter permease [Actomonas aquatica]|uniref:ABC transporter permease n=1 Tax=Actomonas aquatica TaxID=2866162 RepID=A0ABZ1CEF9_9BACT|nr:ABC transporter permease [Opitutus sp. WL0086]WRQ90055.1 ABC transporter permease [Opitutus sp. WL0086]